MRAVAVALLAARDVIDAVLQSQRPRFFLAEFAVISALFRGDGVLILAELLADVFETGERLHAAKPMRIGDGFLQVGGHERLDDRAARRVFLGDDSERDHLLHAIRSDERTDLIAREELHFSFAVPDGHAHAVAIRVRCHDDIRRLLFRQRDGLRERLGIFRIRRLHRRKLAVEFILLRNRRETEAEPLEHRLDDDSTCAVNRRQNHLQPACRLHHRTVEQQRFEAIHVRLVHLRTEHDAFALLRLWQRFVHIARHRIHQLDDCARVRLHDLRAVGKVHLESVIMRRVVRSRDHCTRSRIHMAHGK